MAHDDFKHGATMEDGEATRFSLWAPNASEVALVLNDHDIHPMDAHADGWFSTRLTDVVGSIYRFRIDEKQLVPDPASRQQAQDVHGASRVVDHSSYLWKTAHWTGRPWHEAVIYELHAGLQGGFAGVENCLPELAELGVTAVELMPVADFPGQRNWGYDGVLPFAPATAYGTPEQLKQLIDRAHALGLMVYLDVVYNHFGPDGNYLNHYAKDFFRDDIHTAWGAAIDFRRQQVRDFFCENALMWLLDYRIDGLRFDAVHAISEKDFLVELAQRIRASIPSDRHIHLVLEDEDNTASLLQRGFDAQWNDDGHNALHVMLTGENEGYYADFADQPTRKFARCLSEGFAYQGETNRRNQARGEPSGHLPPSSFVLFLQNHDQTGNRAFGERLRTLANDEALQAATMLVLLCPMVPLLFMGEEWGAREPFLYFTDHHDELADAVREGRRNEFVEFSLFSDSSQRERIPDPNDVSTFTHSIPRYTPERHPEQHTWRNFYRQLLALRREYIIPHIPGSRSEGARVLAEGALLACWRLGDGSRLRIDLNITETPVRTEVPGLTGHMIYTQGIHMDDYRSGVLAPRSAAVSLERNP